MGKLFKILLMHLKLLLCESSICIILKIIFALKLILKYNSLLCFYFQLRSKTDIPI